MTQAARHPSAWATRWLSHHAELAKNTHDPDILSLRQDYDKDQDSGATCGAVPDSLETGGRCAKTMLLNGVNAVAAAMMVMAALATEASGWAWQAKGRGDAANAKADKLLQTKPLDRASEAQAPARDSRLTNLAGRVVDDQGKPVADAQVFFFAPPPLEGKVDPVEVRTQTDAGGLFHLAYPPLGRVALNEVHVWAYRPGSAITAMPNYLTPIDLTLRKPQLRTLKLEGPDGLPIAGAIVFPRVIFDASGSPIAELPDTLSTPLSSTTGPDGQTTINYLASGSDLVAMRVTAPLIGTQDFQLIESPARNAPAAAITIRLKPMSHLAGHVRKSAGEPVAGQTIEVWSRGGSWLQPNPVGFKNGPVRTAADGSFRTPDNLFVGSQYRVVHRAPGFEPTLSRWITIGEEPRVLLPLIQKALRTLRGRVVDRQGKPLANVEVFQSGDGPERTATRSDGDGRFALGGFRQGQVFLFARGKGFRFFGRLIKPGEREITVELTRIGERPTREMRMLPEPIPLEESRALAQRLIGPYLEAAIAQKHQSAIGLALNVLAAADAVGVLRKLEGEEIPAPMVPVAIKPALVRALARSDPDRAREVAESIESARLRSVILVDLADVLPPAERERKLALLAQAERDAREANSQSQAAEVAERWYELGETDKAKALFAESVQFGKENRVFRGAFAARLARVDLPAALAIARELSVGDRNSATDVYWNIALRLAVEHPAEAEAVLRLVPQVPRKTGKQWLPPAIAWKMAQTDPARAHRLVAEAQRFDDEPQAYLALALGSKMRDPAVADEAFRTAMEGIDRLRKEGAEYSALRGIRGVWLPLVEQIDPVLVPELFWRAIATRPPIGNPRSLFDESPSQMAMLLGFYDREVAAAVFEPVRAQIEQTDDQDLAGLANPLQGWPTPFLAWSIIDPRAAVARLEQVPATAGISRSSFVNSRAQVARILGLPYEDRWRRIWTDHTEMRFLLERDIR